MNRCSTDENGHILDHTFDSTDFLVDFQQLISSSSIITTDLVARITLDLPTSHLDQHLPPTTTPGGAYTVTHSRNHTDTSEKRFLLGLDPETQQNPQRMRKMRRAIDPKHLALSPFANGSDDTQPPPFLQP